MAEFIERISARHLNLRPRPTPRILQFGGGNFLRGFIDWKIDRMNEAAGTDWGIVILRSVGGRDGSALNDQDGIYTVVSRGLGGEGTPVTETRVVAAVRGEIDCSADWARVLSLAARPEIAVILSNTTETGIVFDPSARPTDAPPASFPAKLTALLAHRWQTLGKEAPGWQVIPCELTDRAGDTLAAMVRDHASAWNLPAAFFDWLDARVPFYNTLVDRIVTGAPKADRSAVEAVLGYHDPCLTTTELFHFLAIEQRPDQPSLALQLADHDPGTVVVPDVAPLKLRKVAILNGAHTALCPLALLGGVPTVGQALEMPAARRFLNRVLDREILPFLDLPPEDTRAFASEVLRRFSNPFVQHHWHDISLNAVSKIKTRNLDRMAAHQATKHEAPPGLTLSLAAWVLFYLGRFPGADNLPPRDTVEVLDAFAGLRSITDADALARAVLVEARFWGKSIDDPILSEALAQGLRQITDLLPSKPDLSSLLALAE
jgi:tagaturonate reductase